MHYKHQRFAVYTVAFVFFRVKRLCTEPEFGPFLVYLNIYIFFLVFAYIDKIGWMCFFILYQQFCNKLRGNALACSNTYCVLKVHMINEFICKYFFYMLLEKITLYY